MENTQVLLRFTRPELTYHHFYLILLSKASHMAKLKVKGEGKIPCLFSGKNAVMEGGNKALGFITQLMVVMVVHLVNILKPNEFYLNITNIMLKKTNKEMQSTTVSL